jgi:hypothetical protein
MKIHPIFDQVVCVALAASLMMSVGPIVFPYVRDVLDGLEFNAIEAVVSTTVGFGIHAALFG